MLTNRYFWIYYHDITKFLNTLTIYYKPFIQRYNDVYTTAGGVITDNPETFPYYINLLGNYHDQNQTMSITDFTNLSDIELNKDTIINNPNIKKRYLDNYNLYKSLTNKYKDQSHLIRSMFFPVDLSVSEIVELPNLTLLSYDTRYLNNREKDNIIFDIQNFLTYYNNRWVFNTFEYEELYPLASWTILWMVLPLFLLYRKISYMRTGSVDDFHLSNYLESKGLDGFTSYLTENQNLYFYRNIDYLLNNLGKKKIEASLNDELLVPSGMNLQAKHLYHDLIDGEADGHWRVNTQFKPINMDKAPGLKNENLLSTYNNLIESGNEYDQYEGYYSDLKDKLTFTKYNTLITKYQEIKYSLKDYKYYQRYIHFINDTITTLISTDQIKFDILLINDIDSKTSISISPKIAIYLLHYCYFKLSNKTPTKLPTEFYGNVGINDLTRPTIVDDFNYNELNYKISNYIDIESMLNTLTYLGNNDITSNEDLTNYIHDRFNLYKELLSNSRTTEFFKRYAINNVSSQITDYSTTIINNTFSTFNELFASNTSIEPFLALYEINPNLYLDLIYNIYKSFINIDTDIDNYLLSETEQKSIFKEKMKELFIRFNTYLTRILDNTVNRKIYISTSSINYRIRDEYITTEWKFPNKGIRTKFSS